MSNKLASDLPPSPSQISFTAFRKRVSSDKKLSDSIKCCMVDDVIDGELLAALRKAIGDINAS